MSARNHQAARGVTENELNLLSRHSREPLNKFVDCRAALDILEKRPKPERGYA
jgi:hypothetical protein